MDNHWLIDEILNVENLDRSDDDEFYRHIDAALSTHPQLSDPSITNPMLAPVMRNDQIDNDIKIAIWQAKVGLDSDIKVFKEDYPDRM